MTYTKNPGAVAAAAGAKTFQRTPPLSPNGRRRQPPYGKALSARLAFRNPPFLVVVTVGLDEWNRAKTWAATPNDITALVLPPGEDPARLSWPVSGCLCVIDVAAGPNEQQIEALARELFIHGAASVTARTADGLIRYQRRAA